jgi:2'-5' RNA ligase
MSAPDTIRAFWALELDAPARRRAAAVSSLLRAASWADRIRWVREESLHMTLRFLGSIEPARVAPLAREVGAATRGIAPFAARLAGLEFIPSPRRPRVVALGLEPTAALEDLAAALEHGVVAAGFAAEPRPFRAHVTLGRIRPGRRLPPEDLARVTASVTASAETWDVMEAVLFRSDLGSNGTRYVALARVPLGSGGHSLHP